MPSSRLLDLVERLATLMRATRHRLPGRPQPVHLLALHYLSRCNRYSNTPGALASYLGATRGATSQSLQVLERRRLVRRRRDSTDRRVVRLQLTLDGKRLLEKQQEYLSHQLEQWKAVPPAELAIAEQVLEQLLRHLQRANRYQTFGICRTCRHLLREGPDRFRCGLTLETLAPSETRQICHEHEYPPPGLYHPSATPRGT